MAHGIGKSCGLNLEWWLSWDKVEMEGASDWSRVSLGADGNILELRKLMLVG